jgi:hypothetical protein
VFTLLRLIFLPIRVALGTTKVGVKAGFVTGRLLGYRRLFVFAAGVGVGLLLAPITGREARAKLTALLNGSSAGGGGDLAERVSFELSHAPRTWHLPQPSVEVLGDTAVLRGTAPHETGRADLERTAAAVAGVARVDNRISVATAEDHGGTGTNGAH